MMRDWLLVLGLTVPILAAVAIRFELKTKAQLKSEAKKTREAAYQSALQRYSDKVRPGMTRKAVETSFRGESVKFSRIGWLEEWTAADLIKIGADEVPWYCSENYVYIAFQFAATEPHEPSAAFDTDVLTTIRIFRQLTGCL